MLEVIKISKSFGGLSALTDITLEAEKGNVVGIIGPNGAGKTTLFNCLTGLYYPTTGQIIFDRRPIVPQLNEKKMKNIRKCLNVFILISVIWAPIFWSIFFPHTYFKVEITLLTIFLLAIRLIVIRGLKDFQIWAWGLGLVFIAFDLYLAVWSNLHTSILPKLVGTPISLSYIAIPWSILAVMFGLYLFCLLICKDGRQLFGFRTGPDAINRFGISRTFQNIRLFMNLSVLDNVKIGAHGRMRCGVFSSILNFPSKLNEEKQIETEAFDRLKFVGLEKFAFDLAGSLPYGEQRRLEIARALASNPSLILLDEPAAGMNPAESGQLIKLIRKIRENGITVVMIEHDMKVMMNLADFIYVLDHGALIAQGTPDEIRSNPKVIEAYLGRS